MLELPIGSPTNQPQNRTVGRASSLSLPAAIQIGILFWARAREASRKLTQRLRSGIDLVVLLASSPKSYPSPHAYVVRVLDFGKLKLSEAWRRSGTGPGARFAVHAVHQTQGRLRTTQNPSLQVFQTRGGIMPSYFLCRQKASAVCLSI